MANAQGDLIIIGVEDSSLTVVDMPDGRMALTRDMVLWDAALLGVERNDACILNVSQDE